MGLLLVLERKLMKKIVSKTTAVFTGFYRIL